jgi:hypothetical protein
MEQAMASGSTVALAGTPHLWIADEAGVLHWAGDTRALAGHFVDWGNRREVSLDQLRALQRGDPWLTAGLLKSGDPIYFVKWETEWASPQLLQIQSIADVELFGINGSNYGAMVLDQSAWEQRYAMGAVALQRGVLAPATVASSPAAPPATVARRAAPPASAPPVAAPPVATTPVATPAGRPPAISK